MNIPNRLCRHCGWEILLQGRYRVLRLLGEGGFSKTFEVQDGETQKVLKVLLDNHAKTISLFRQEAWVLSQLQHLGIPKVEAGAYFTILPRASQQPLHCLVMEKIDGLNLEQWLKQRKYQPISEKQAIEWLKQLATILEEVHKHEYFHRDIKPSNIMLRSNGELVLIDFGTAREISDTYLAKVSGGQKVTSIISAGYTPLEQVNGKAVPQSDFFALGRTFVYLLTGKPPSDFPEHPATGELLWRNSARQVSNPLADFIDRLMSPFPGNRPANTHEILQYLAGLEFYLRPNPLGRQFINQIYPHSVVINQPLQNLANVGKFKPKKIPKFFTRLLAVNALLMMVFAGSQIYDYFRPYSYYPKNFYGKQKVREKKQAAIAAENIYTWQIKDSLFGYFSKVNAVAFSPDGQVLAIGSDDKTIKLWYLTNGKRTNWWNNLSGINAIAFSPDGQTIASASTDNTIKLWNVSLGKLRHTLSGHGGWVSSVAFSPDGKTIASGSDDNTIKLWDAKAGQLQRTLKGHSASVSSVAFSPDGKILASGSFDNTIKLWNAATGDLKTTLIAKSLRVRSLAFSPDGEIIAIGTGEGTIELWNLTTFKLEKTLTGHQDAVTAIAFSPDGQKMASSGDSTIKIWDAKSITLIETLTGHTDAVDAIAFSPRNPILASGSDDNTVKIWPLNRIEESN